MYKYKFLIWPLTSLLLLSWSFLSRVHRTLLTTAPATLPGPRRIFFFSLSQPWVTLTLLGLKNWLQNYYFVQHWGTGSTFHSVQNSAGLWCRIHSTELCSWAWEKDIFLSVIKHLFAIYLFFLSSCSAKKNHWKVEIVQLLERTLNWWPSADLWTGVFFPELGWYLCHQLPFNFYPELLACKQNTNTGNIKQEFSLVNIQTVPESMMKLQKCLLGLAWALQVCSLHSAVRFWGWLWQELCLNRQMSCSAAPCFLWTRWSEREAPSKLHAPCLLGDIWEGLQHRFWNVYILCQSHVPAPHRPSFSSVWHQFLSCPLKTETWRAAVLYFILVSSPKLFLVSLLQADRWWYLVSCQF